MEADGKTREFCISMKFEDLEAWQQARTLVCQVYTLTRSGVLEKDYSLIDQIRRACVSIMSNLAEGFERSHVREKLQAYNIARASCGEVRSLLYVIEDNYPESGIDLASLRTKAAEVGRLISGLLVSTHKRLQ
jgi:four helix bundle protein